MANQTPAAKTVMRASDGSPTLLNVGPDAHAFQDMVEIQGKNMAARPCSAHSDCLFFVDGARD